MFDGLQCLAVKIIYIVIFLDFLSTKQGRMQIKKRQAYSQLSILQQIVYYFTRPLLVLSGLELVAFKKGLLCTFYLIRNAKQVDKH